MLKTLDTFKNDKTIVLSILKQIYNDISAGKINNYIIKQFEYISVFINPYFAVITDYVIKILLKIIFQNGITLVNNVEIQIRMMTLLNSNNQFFAISSLYYFSKIYFEMNNCKDLMNNNKFKCTVHKSISIIIERSNKNQLSNVLINNAWCYTIISILDQLSSVQRVDSVNKIMLNLNDIINVNKSSDSIQIVLLLILEKFKDKLLIRNPIEHLKNLNDHLKESEYLFFLFQNQEFLNKNTINTELVNYIFKMLYSEKEIIITINLIILCKLLEHNDKLLTYIPCDLPLRISVFHSKSKIIQSLLKKLLLMLNNPGDSDKLCYGVSTPCHSENESLSSNYFTPKIYSSDSAFSTINNAVSQDDKLIIDFQNKMLECPFMPNPLKEKEESVSKCQKRKTFTDLEIKNILRGVKKYGTKWTTIHQAYRFNDSRTPQSLKDKFNHLKKRIISN